VQRITTNLRFAAFLTLISWIDGSLSCKSGLMDTLANRVIIYHSGLKDGKSMCVNMHASFMYFLMHKSKAPVGKLI